VLLRRYTGVLHLWPPHVSNRYFADTQMHRGILCSFGFPHVFSILFWVISMARWPCPRTAFLLQTALAVEFWVIAVGGWEGRYPNIPKLPKSSKPERV
jgi:hypothetical protein